ncbi:hypothetical protein [Kitasatospora brasiliensis]|uniref:hypothetical protein n=1 Tax=Kitasatospora brasiliensis TaxID=3058040 RepID=UPI00292F5AB4|nr:hypothetical protein [Kitasatospora sp. K002]
MELKKRIAAVTASLAAFASTALVLAPDASAVSWNGCNYPQVCFYQNIIRWNAGNPDARYQDITSGYQNLSTAARGANYVYNTRNDDVAWLRYIEYGETKYTCLSPNSMESFDAVETLTGIKISSASHC